MCNNENNYDFFRLISLPQPMMDQREALLTMENSMPTTPLTNNNIVVMDTSDVTTLLEKQHSNNNETIATVISAHGTHLASEEAIVINTNSSHSDGMATSTCTVTMPESAMVTMVNGDECNTAVIANQTPLVIIDCAACQMPIKVRRL